MGTHKSRQRERECVQLTWCKKPKRERKEVRGRKKFPFFPGHLRLLRNLFIWCGWLLPLKVDRPSAAIKKQCIVLY